MRHVAVFLQMTISLALGLSATGNDFRAGTPKQLLPLPTGAVDWDVTADGKRVLVAVDPNPVMAKRTNP